jgi:hypothetical protein
MRLMEVNLDLKITADPLFENQKPGQAVSI